MMEDYGFIAEKEINGIIYTLLEQTTGAQYLGFTRYLFIQRHNPDGSDDIKEATIEDWANPERLFE